MVLKSFQVFRGDIGYVQGMSQLVYILHQVFRDEFLTFEFFVHLILKKYPLYEFYTFNAKTVVHFSKILKYFVDANIKKKPDGLNFFLENMVGTYLYSIFFTLFVGFFEEKDIYVILDLVSFQNYSILLYLAIIILLLFAKEGSEIVCSIADLKAYCKKEGLQGIIRKGRQFNLKLQEIVEEFEKNIALNDKSGPFIESDQSNR